MIVIITIASDTMYIMSVLHGCGVFAALGWGPKNSFELMLMLIYTRPLKDIYFYV